MLKLRCTATRCRVEPVRRVSLRRTYLPEYSIAHGIDMQLGMRQQGLAVASGYWPLFRFNPAMRKVGENPFRLDSIRPRIPFKDYAYNEIRYHALTMTRPDEAEELAHIAQSVVNEKYHYYEQLAGLDGGRFHPPASAAVK